MVPGPPAGLNLRAAVLDAVRDFFRREKFLEVETPLRVPAPAPESHIEPVASGSWYLSPSPELCMKRLLAAGFPRIYQICKAFREGERGPRHLPEMTLLEWYLAHADYRTLMDQTRALVCQVTRKIFGRTALTYQGRTIDLSGAWPRLTVAEAFWRFGALDLPDVLAQGRFDEELALHIEPYLGVDRPLFLYDYPLEKGALARPRPDAPRIAERFELYIAGVELCNGFSELTDPDVQRRRFETEMELRRKAGKALWPLPERFLDALCAMPAAAGNALGLDRLIMLLADAERIDDVVAFTPEML